MQHGPTARKHCGIPSPLVGVGQDGRKQVIQLTPPLPVSLLQGERGQWPEKHSRKTTNYRCLSVFLLCLFSLFLFACAPEKETSKALVKISSVKVWRTDNETLKVSLNYDLEMGVHLPLPYKEILVFPLDPQVKVGGTLTPFDLHSGTVGVTLQLPKGAVDWNDLSEKDACCVVSLKGVVEDPSTKAARYERISNEVRVPPPQLSEQVSS